MSMSDTGNEGSCADECIDTHEDTWKCGNECISITEACDENETCFYDKDNSSNYNSQGLSLNTPVYCRNTKKCVRSPHHICNFTASTADHCLISKETCATTFLSVVAHFPTFS